MSRPAAELPVGSASLAVLAVALAVRLIYLGQSSYSPTFDYPVVDAEHYDDLARRLASGAGIDGSFFFQPVLYPVFLAVVYAFTGGSILAAKVLQMLLGAATCVLTYRLGRRTFGHHIGLLAALITAGYGPLVFEESELLATGWAAFWSVVLLGLLIRAADEQKAGAMLALGAVVALSVLTRPDFILFLGGAAAWLTGRVIRRRSTWAGAVGKLALVAVGFAVVALPPAALCRRVVGHYGILPTSGGVNLYVGNNENLCETLTIRPGAPWAALVRTPGRQGITGDRERSQFFVDKVRRFALEQPRAFAKGLAEKAARFVNGREIPRNVDIYLFREWSSLLGLLVWKIGGFGFPWGVVFPLAVIGLVVRRKDVPWPLILLVALYPLTIVLVFVAGRYRAPIVPATALLAAAGVYRLADLARARRYGRVGGLVVLAMAIGAAAARPPSFCEERINYAAELYGLAGEQAGKHGRMTEAASYFERALNHDPESGRAHNGIGVALAREGKLDEAIARFDRALRVDDDEVTYYNRGQAYQAKRDWARALRDLDKAIELNPGFAAAYCERGVVYREQRRFDLAQAEWEQVLELCPAGPVAERAGDGLAVLRLRQSHR